MQLLLQEPAPKTQVAIIAACIEHYLSCRKKRKRRGEIEMTTDKVKEVQNYLEKRGIIVAETRIIDAAIRIARRWGGNEVFVCEFKRREAENEKEIEC